MNKPRTINFDDGKFERDQDKTILVGVVLRGTEKVENVVSSKISIDGDDSTKKITGLVNECDQSLKTVFLDGIAVAGLNIVDVKELYERTETPVIVISRKRPKKKAVKEALKNVSNKEKKLKSLENTEEAEEHENIFFQSIGIGEKETKKRIERNKERESIPKGLRLAHLIASGVSDNV